MLSDPLTKPNAYSTGLKQVPTGHTKFLAWSECLIQKKVRGLLEAQCDGIAIDQISNVSFFRQILLDCFSTAETFQRAKWGERSPDLEASNINKENF